MKKFKDLGKRGQKMKIVRDAIAQIKIGMFIPLTQHYLRVLSKNDIDYYYLQSYDDLQKVLQVQKCEACAKGAIFASCVLNVDKVSGRDNYSDESFFKKKLKRWFSPLELDMIEAAFEKQVVQDSTNLLYTTDESLNRVPTKLGKECIKFGKRYRSDKNRLLAILNNILKNKEFKP